MSQLKDVFINYTSAQKIFDIENSTTYESGTYSLDVVTKKTGKVKDDVDQFSIKKNLVGAANPEDGVVFELQILEYKPNGYTKSESALTLSLKGPFNERAYENGEIDVTVEKCVINGVTQDVSKPIDIKPLYKKLASLLCKADVEDMGYHGSSSGTLFKSVIQEHQVYSKFKNQLTK